MGTRDKKKCEWCGRLIAVNGVFELWRHNNWSGKPCAGSGKGLVSQTLKFWVDRGFNPFAC